MWHNSILETVGNTPLIKLNHIAPDVEATLLAKVEYFNPGQSVKDRIALKMLDDAEKEGKIKPGGTIIEGTSGNTGMGLALAAVVKGYKCIFTTNDKQSKEKIDILKVYADDRLIVVSDELKSLPIEVFYLYFNTFHSLKRFCLYNYEIPAFARMTP
jgi:cystathionine beta-synthase